MRTIGVVLLCAGLAAGCGGKPDPGPADKLAPELHGYWSRNGDGIADFVEIYFRADGTYSLDTGIVCVDEPCPSDGAGTWKSTDFARSKAGTLVLKGGQDASYDAVLTTGAPKTLRLRRKDDDRDRDAVFTHDPKATR